jgi:hypothetical protein
MKKLTSPFKLIEKSINLFKIKENLIFLVKIYLPLVIFPIISIVFAYIPFFAKNTNSTWYIVLISSIRIVFMLVSTFITASAIIAMPKIIEGEDMTPKKVFKEAWKNYWMFLLLNVVICILYALGFVLLIVPGLLLIVWFVFSRFVMIEKQTRIKESLLRSKQLAKGYYWKILWRLIVFAVFGLLVEIVLGAIPYGIGSIIWTLFGSFFVLLPYLLYKEISE